MMNNREKAISMENNMKDTVEELALHKIDPFPNHPFQVRDDEDMEDLIASIKERGIITPAIVRPHGKGRYELVAGHRRFFACVKLGLPSMRCEIREMSKEEATILMVESNFQRSRILPSEKAFAYRMRLEAMRKMREKGVRPVGAEVRDNRTDEMLAQEVGDSARQIQRYIRLTELIPELLKMVDEGEMGMRTAVELSYLGDWQEDIHYCIELEQCAPTHAQSIRLRRLYEKDKLTLSDVQKIMAESKPNQKERVIIRNDRLEKLLPKNLPVNKREEYILSALEYYKRYLQKKSREPER